MTRGVLSVSFYFYDIIHAGDPRNVISAAAANATIYVILYAMCKMIRISRFKINRNNKMKVQNVFSLYNSTYNIDIIFDYYCYYDAYHVHRRVHIARNYK